MTPVSLAKLGDKVDIAVVFSAPITVTGSPTLEVGVSPAAVDAPFTAVGGAGNEAHFQYTASLGETAFPLDVVSVNSFRLKTAVVTGPGGVAVDATLPPPGGTASLARSMIRVDAEPPRVDVVESRSPDGHYVLDQSVTISVRFSEAVTVTGTPSLVTNCGAIPTFQGGSGTATLLFQFTVTGGMSCLDLDLLNASALQGGTITDAAGNPANLAVPFGAAPNSLASTTNISVDGSRPLLLRLASTTNGTFGVGAQVNIDVSFTRDVVVTGTPRLTLDVGVPHEVPMSVQVSSTVLRFTYTVQAGHQSPDLDAATTPSALVMPGGTLIRDPYGVDAVVALPPSASGNRLAQTSAVVVDGVAPRITSVDALVPDGTYVIGETVTLRVNFSEGITPAALAMHLGVLGQQRGVLVASGANYADFRLTVIEGDFTADLDVTGVVVTSGGLPRDGAGNDALLTLPTPSFATTHAIVVDGYKVAVRPRYGSAFWNSYVRPNGEACSGDPTEDCSHAGSQLEIRTGRPTCPTTVTDSAGVFTWNCAIEGGVAVVRTTRINTGKGVADLVQDLGGGLWRWRALDVQLQGAGPPLTTPDRQTWQDLIVEHASTQPVVPTVSNYVHVVRGVVPGVHFAADAVSVVTLGSGVIQGSGYGCSVTTGEPGGANCGVSAGDQKFLWLEATAAGGYTNLLVLGDVVHSRIRRLSGGATGNIRLSRVNRSILEDVAQGTASPATTNLAFCSRNQLFAFSGHAPLVEGGSDFNQLVAGDYTGRLVVAGSDNLVTKLGTHGVDVMGARNTLDDVAVTAGGTGGGITVLGNGHAITSAVVTGGSNNSIHLQAGSNNVVVADSVLDSSPWNGVLVSGGVHTITNVHSSGHSFNGFEVQAGSATFTGCTAELNAYHGFNLHGSGHTITGSTGRNNSSTGVVLNTGTADIQVVDTEVSGNTTGISVSGTGHDVVRARAWANSGSGLQIIGNDNWVVDSVSAANSTGVELVDGADFNRLVRTRAFNNTSDGVMDSGTQTVHVGLISNHNGGAGLRVTPQSNVPRVFLIQAHANGGPGLRLESTNGARILGAYLTNNAFGFYITDSSSYFIAQVVARMNGSGNNIRVENSTSGEFHGIVGATGAACTVVGSTTGAGIDNSCNPVGSSTFTRVVIDVAATQFLARILVDDSSNTSDVAGVATLPSPPATLDWTHFDNVMRTWGRNIAWPYPAGTSGQMTTGQVAIWDWRLSAGDTTVLNRSDTGSGTNAAITAGTDCPSWLDGTTAALNDNGVTFLRTAWEDVEDAVGDNDGACENNETCWAMPNFTVYQGHFSSGDTNPPTCVYTPGTGLPTGVTMQFLPANGF